MPIASLTLEQDNLDQLAAWLDGEAWVIACLCAAWCDTCNAYRQAFDALAARHPDKHFVWIDIEDRADLVGDIDVENFPTLLIQRRDQVRFFGTVLPDAGLADRLIQTQVESAVCPADNITAAAGAAPVYNLRARLADLHI